MSGQREGDESVSTASVVLDWGGTVTEVDGLDLVLSEFGDPEIYAQVEGELGRTLTLNKVIAAEFATVKALLAEVVSWLLAHTRVRPGFREFCERHRPLIVSSGFRELIEPVLRRERIVIAPEIVELRANRVEPRPEGWRAVFRDGAVCGTCSEPCKRADLAEGFTVFVGDGYADRCAALAANGVFATGGLAPYLDEQHTPYEPFDDFHQLAAALAGRLR